MASIPWGPAPDKGRAAQKFLEEEERKSGNLAMNGIRPEAQRQLDQILADTPGSVQWELKHAWPGSSKRERDATIRQMDRGEKKAAEKGRLLMGMKPDRNPERLEAIAKTKEELKAMRKERRETMAKYYRWAKKVADFEDAHRNPDPKHAHDFIMNDDEKAEYEKILEEFDDLYGLAENINFGERTEEEKETNNRLLRLLGGEVTHPKDEKERRKEERDLARQKRKEHPVREALKDVFVKGPEKEVHRIFSAPKPPVAAMRILQQD